MAVGLSSFSVKPSDPDIPQYLLPRTSVYGKCFLRRLVKRITWYSQTIFLSYSFIQSSNATMCDLWLTSYFSFTTSISQSSTLFRPDVVRIKKRWFCLWEIATPSFLLADITAYFHPLPLKVTGHIHFPLSSLPTTRKKAPGGVNSPTTFPTPSSSTCSTSYVSASKDVQWSPRQNINPASNHVVTEATILSLSTKRKFLPVYFASSQTHSQLIVPWFLTQLTLLKQLS